MQYFDLLLITKKAKFILINSSDDVNEIKIKLKNYLSEEFHAGPTILLTHHRIWDDTIISELPFQHDKSYYFDEIFPIIKDKINYIFSGNSKRQYFKDMSNSPYYGKQNINNIFWMDKIGNINAYSIGMGDAEPKANFTIVDIFEKNLMITGDYSSVNNFEILSRNLIEPNPVNFNKSDYEKKYFFIKKKSLFKYSLIVLAFFLLIIGYFIRNIKRSNFN